MTLINNKPLFPPGWIERETHTLTNPGSCHMRRRRHSPGRRRRSSTRSSRRPRVSTSTPSTTTRYLHWLGSYSGDEAAALLLPSFPPSLCPSLCPASGSRVPLAGRIPSLSSTYNICGGVSPPRSTQTNQTKTNRAPRTRTRNCATLPTLRSACKSNEICASRRLVDCFLVGRGGRLRGRLYEYGHWVGFGYGSLGGRKGVQLMIEAGRGAKSDRI